MWRRKIYIVHLKRQLSDTIFGDVITFNRLAENNGNIFFPKGVLALSNIPTYQTLATLLYEFIYYQEKNI